MVNPGEMHDGVPLDSNPRRWRMIYIDPVVMAREVEEETVGPVEIVRPVAHDPLLAGHLARLFACLTAPQSDRLAEEENLLCSLMHVLRRHAVARLLALLSLPVKSQAPAAGQNIVASEKS